MMRAGEFRNFPLDNGLELMKCKDEKDLGEKVECPHQYAKCYKVWFGCYTSPDKKEKRYFRGCGGFATLGNDIVNPKMRETIFGKEDIKRHHATGDSEMVDLPDAHFPTIQAYMTREGCMKRNHTNIPDANYFQDEGGQLNMCDRVFCNTGQIKTPLVALLGLSLLVLLMVENK
eukprot:TRINITY_DN13937_c0_g1_i1.p1 TRINITY_DN13937_c0_g1~~TRINITY_DN13937_c0_g1_i1.p1  ORF type:complete len:174 (-),score=44.92 TRINITY_DN13937_c0_g1_i1:28-549(-)